jgi:DNA polymerase I
MRTIGIDLEYDYCDPFLCTTTDEDLVSRVYRLKVLSQKREVRKICENRNIQKIFHHASGDMFQLRCIGIEVKGPVECTFILSNLVDENFKPKELKTLARVHLQIDTSEANRLKGIIKKFKEKAKKGGYPFKWSQLPDEYIIPYAKRDPEYTLKLWHYWQTPLEESRKLYEFEKSLMPIIVDMEWKGLRIDRSLCRNRGYEYGKKLESLYEEMSKYIVDNNIVLGKDFNSRSPKQIQDIILQLGMEDKVEHGKTMKNRHLPKTDKKALVILSNDSTFFSMLSKSRFFAKHKGTYYDPLYEYYTSEKSDIAHFLMYQTGAKTGRFSVELAQTFPKREESKLAGELHEVRKCIIPRRGKAFLLKDYEQQEARLFCHYANCQRMIDIINEKTGTKGFDIYTETGDVLFGELFQREKLRKALRFTAKTDFLGAIYGMGVKKLVSGTTGLLYEKFDRSVVEEIGVNDQWAYDTLKKFKEIYPVDQFNRECMSELYKTGVMKLEFNSELMKFKREYHIPQDFAYKAGNAKIQGSAAYIIKCAMLRCNNRIKKEKWEDRVSLSLQVHDELIFEVLNDMSFIKEVDAVLTEEMEDRVTFKVPITVSAKVSDISWGDAIPIEEYYAQKIKSRNRG